MPNKKSKIMQVMKNAENLESEASYLVGEVAVVDAYYGGEKSNQARRKAIHSVNSVIAVMQHNLDVIKKEMNKRMKKIEKEEKPGNTQICKILTNAFLVIIASFNASCAGKVSNPSSLQIFTSPKLVNFFENAIEYKSTK